MLLIFLPPLLYGAAFFTSLRDLRRNARPIALLSIGVVFATMGAVAVVAHEVIGLGWAESFVLGAIVSPTDAVAPAEIMRRIGARAGCSPSSRARTLPTTGPPSCSTASRWPPCSGAFSLGRGCDRVRLSGVGGLAIGLVAGS